MELAFQRVPGVIKTAVGYSGGHKANPTYEEVRCCYSLQPTAGSLQPTAYSLQPARFVVSG